MKHHLSPWQKLGKDSFSVIGMRLMALPWQMALAPANGRREIHRMFAEKEAAWAETQLALISAPFHFWMTLCMNVPLRGPQAALQEAIGQANRSILAPSTTRVRGNLKRLSRKD